MKEIVDNLEEYLSMSKQENLEFLDQLYHLMNQINADAVDYQGLKIHHAPTIMSRLPEQSHSKKWIPRRTTDVYM